MRGAEFVDLVSQRGNIRGAKLDLAKIGALMENHIGNRLFGSAIGDLHALIEIDSHYAIALPVQGIEDYEAIHAGCDGVGQGRHTAAENLVALISSRSSTRILYA